MKLFGRVYSIGIYAGLSPLALAPAAATANGAVLTRESVIDRFATFVADPFMIRVDGTWHMFFEVMSWAVGSKKGEIALATSRDGVSWTYQGVVLAEPFHLSYPYVFEWGGDHYLIPESSAAGAIRLYRADPFPRRWVLVTTLLNGPVLLDNSVFHREGRWWMFSATSRPGATLRLFTAPQLEGPWSEHPASPVVASDPRVARPGGRILAYGDRLLRFAQDCRTEYGSRLRAVEITELTPRRYSERELLDGAPVLAGSGRGWNAMGMHHLDAHQVEDGTWLACVDGWSNRVRRPREIARWAIDRWT